MLCCYLDDAGNTGQDLDDQAQPIHYNGALIVPDSQWTELSTEVKNLKYAAQQKGHKGPFELHGVDVFQGQKNGKGWGGMKFDDRLELYRQAIEILTSRSIPLLLGCCDKPSLKLKYSNPDHPHAIAMLLCLERIAKYAKQHNTLAFVVADDCSPSVKNISRTVLDKYRKSGAPYGITVDLSRLIDTIHFMVSNQSPHIQLCDMALYAIRRFEATKDPKIKDIATSA